MGKDSPLVKELYALFANNNIPDEVKPAEYKNNLDKYGHIETNCWQNAFNKAKNDAEWQPPATLEYARLKLLSMVY